MSNGHRPSISNQMDNEHRHQLLLLCCQFKMLFSPLKCAVMSQMNVKYESSVALDWLTSIQVLSVSE